MFLTLPVAAPGDDGCKGKVRICGCPVGEVVVADKVDDAKARSVSFSTPLPCEPRKSTYTRASRIDIQIQPRDDGAAKCQSKHCVGREEKPDLCHQVSQFWPSARRVVNIRMASSTTAAPRNRHPLPTSPPHWHRHPAGPWSRERPCHRQWWFQTNRPRPNPPRSTTPCPRAGAVRVTGCNATARHDWPLRVFLR